MFRRTINKKTYSLSIGLLILMIDQAYKYKIRQIGGFYICNPGISFGIILPTILLWLIMAVFLMLIVSFIKSKDNQHLDNYLYFGLLLVFFGAASNILDRVTVGCIIDYINFFQNIFPVFNLADCLIFIGSSIILYSLLSSKASKRE